jgi:hypothetical protein
MEIMLILENKKAEVSRFSGQIFCFVTLCCIWWQFLHDRPMQFLPASADTSCGQRLITIVKAGHHTAMRL